MKRKFKNKELEEILTNASHLGTYPMPGDLTLAVIGTRKKLKRLLKPLPMPVNKLVNRVAKKTKKENHLLSFKKDENGKDLLDHPKKLKFKDPATELAALDELKKLGEQEVEIEVKELDISTIEELKSVTPIQMEAITALIEISTSK